MNGVYIEWLKSRRTKSISIVIILMLVATLWNIATFISAFSSHPELRMAGTLFSNQNVNLLMFPIAVCVFASRIVGNEHEGQTFKLQIANGQSLTAIFRDKIFFYAGFLCYYVCYRNYDYLSFRNTGRNLYFFADYWYSVYWADTCNIFIDLSLSDLGHDS